MLKLATKNCFTFEPKMPVALDAIANTTTPAPLMPKIGPLANLAYKTSTFAFYARLSAVPTIGSVTVKLMSGATELAATVVALNGASTIGAEMPVSLFDVLGDQPLSVEVQVTAAADAGITADLDSVLYIEQPLTVYGC